MRGRPRRRLRWPDCSLVVVPNSGRWQRGSRSARSTACTGQMFVTRPPSANCGRCSARGSKTQSSSPLTTHRLTAVSCGRAVSRMVSSPSGCHSLAPSSSLGRNGKFTRRSYPMFAAHFVSHCATTIRVPMQRHVRASFSPLKRRDGGPDVGECRELTPIKRSPHGTGKIVR